MLGCLPLGSRSGDIEVLKIQVTRSLAELVFFPDMLGFSSENLEWSETEEGFSAKYKFGEAEEASVEFHLDENGDVSMVTSPNRPYDLPKGES